MPQSQKDVWRQLAFEELEKQELADRQPRVQTLLDNCPKLTFDICNLVLHASMQGGDKLDEVLNLLEDHYNKHLSHQHPEVRGTVSDTLLGGVNKTHLELIRICEDVLHLEPTQKRA